MLAIKQLKILLLTLMLAQFSTVNALENKAINEYVERIMDRYSVPGAAIAVIKNGKLVHKKYYGFANLEHQVPVRKHTIFPILSTTKLPVSVAVFKLIEEKKLALDEPINKYIDDLPLSWQNISISQLLSHSSGLPEIAKYEKKPEEDAAQKTYKDELQSKPGEQFQYNQTNYWLLMRAIEKVTGQVFEEYILKKQFSDNENTVLFSTNMLEIVNNRANRYTYFNERSEFESDAQRNGTYLNSCNGLNLTLDSFISWAGLFNTNKLISSKSKKSMWSDVEYTVKDIAFAHGWEIHKTNNTLSYGFSGGYTSAFRTYQKDDITIIWLTNGFKEFYRTDPVVNYIAGLVDKELEDVNSIATERLIHAFTEKEKNIAINDYKQVKNDFPNVNTQNILNGIGYRLVNKKQIDRAIAVFRLNVDENPASWNVYDSLAEALLKKNDIPNAIINYKKAIELNVDNDKYTTRIQKLIDGFAEN